MDNEAEQLGRHERIARVTGQRLLGLITDLDMVRQLSKIVDTYPCDCLACST